MRFHHQLFWGYSCWQLRYSTEGGPNPADCNGHLSTVDHARGKQGTADGEDGNTDGGARGAHEAEGSRPCIREPSLRVAQ